MQLTIYLYRYRIISKETRYIKHDERMVFTMARRKKDESNRSDGRVNLSFRYAGKVYTVTAKTKEDAILKKQMRLEQLKSGAESRENPTLNEYYQRFTENRRATVQESTIRSQTCQFNDAAAVIIPGTGKTFGELHVIDIKAADVQQVQRALKDAGRTTETVNNILAHVSHVFNRAVRERLIDWNPCSAVDKLQRTEVKAKDSIHRALDAAETKTFFEAMAGSYYENICKMMIQTGMRVGEVGALMVSDFDMKEGVIHVTKTVARREDGSYYVSPTPKTDAGNRDIPMNDIVKQVFRNQLKLNEQIHGRVELDKPVFRSYEGELIREYFVNREIKRKIKQTGIEHFTSHAFRATFATRFIEQCPQDYKILSEILGHADVRVTLNLYAAHRSKDKQQAAMNGFMVAM